MKNMKTVWASAAFVLGLACAAQPAFSLTGKLAYACSGKICIRDLSTGATITGPSGVNPKFNVGGTLIAYQSAGVWVVNPDGTGAHAVNSVGSIPSFSPDGQWIVFHEGSSGLRKIMVDGTGLTTLTTHGRQGAWSPDGTQIAFSSSDGGTDSDLWVVNADGTNAHKLVTRAGADIDVVWLRSSKILFGGDAGGSSGYEIYSFDPATSAVTRLTTRSKNDFEPSWSPDATQAVWASLGSPAGVYVMNADGSGQTLVVSGARQPSWGE